MQKIPCCRAHYGGKYIKRYYGPIYQRGSGFLGDIFRRFVPIVTNKILPYVGRKLYESGPGVIKDLEQGETVGTALRRGVKRTLESGKQDLLKKLRGEGIRKKKKKRDFFAHI